MSKLRSIQVLRGVAACGVVMVHATGPSAAAHAGRVGAYGVDLFFVISGFIMATIAANQRPGRFLADRVWRIWPLWLIALAPWLIVKRPGAAETLASVFLWPIYDNAFHLPALGVGWTLGFEMLFYLAFALGLATRAAVPLAIFAAAAAASLVMPGNALFAYLGSGLIPEFLAGVIVAQLPKRERLALPCLALAIAWAMLPARDYSAIVIDAATWGRAAHWGVPAALVVYAAVSAERRVFAGSAWAPAVFIGDASYSIYLFHRLFAQQGNDWAFGMGLALAAGCAAYIVFERPLLRLHQRHAAAAAGRRRSRFEPGADFDQRRDSAIARIEPGARFDLRSIKRR